MGRLPTVVVDLGDGDLVELNKYVLVKTQRALQEYCVANTPEGLETTPETLKGHEKEIVKILFVNQAVELKVKTVQVVKTLWFTRKTLKEHRFIPPFDYGAILKVMDDVGLEKLHIIEREMNRLYTPDPFGQPPESGSPQTRS